MICKITRWRISRYLDTGRPLSVSAARHIHRCTACGEFLRSTRILEDKLRAEAPGFLPGSEDPLNDRILSVLPANSATDLPGRRRFMTAPVLTATLVLFVVGAALLLQIGREKIPVTGEDIDFPLTTALNTGGTLPQVRIDLESPIEGEMRALAKTLTDAAQQLLDGLDLESTADGPRG